jgi:hypothetical protein
MTVVKTVLWYGEPPSPGIQHLFDVRGFTIRENPASEAIEDWLLGQTLVVVFNYTESNTEKVEAGYEHLAMFIQHGLRLLFVGVATETVARIREEHFKQLDAEYPWDDSVRFLPHLKGLNFDVVIDCPPGPRWRNLTIKQDGNFKKLGDEEHRLVSRAFGKADEIQLLKIAGGYTGARVFMAHEKRREVDASIGHWSQPRLVKVGSREEVSKEVLAMNEVSPFIPFELRPNLETSIKGLRKAIYVADFVDKSESMLDVARAGRAEGAISNLFNRTLQRWRDRANQRDKQFGSLAEAAEQIGFASADWIQSGYLQSEKFRKCGHDIKALWATLSDIKFSYRAATIHGDLHGENVRVRGDDAILIDLGAVRGKTEVGQGAPLCFDVATLEVSLAFHYRGVIDGPNTFEQPLWESEIRPFYNLDAILSTPSIDSAPQPDSWLFGCLQRIRAFGIYQQSHRYEYAIALTIALWRYCKFPPSQYADADEGRRVVALILGAEIVKQIEGKERESNSHSR